jgi:uncharacterized protein (TIGR02145 family)
MKKSLFTLLALVWCIAAMAQSGEITNLLVEQRPDGSGLVDVYYNLSGNENSYFVNMRVSFDGGASFTPISINAMSGDVKNVSPGQNKQIVWNPTVNHPNRYSQNAQLKIVAYHVNLSNACPEQPLLEDIDGNLYHTLQLGDQCWMASNLNTTRNADGDQITRYCYNNDPDYCEMYGGLYNWNTLMNGASSSGSNPSGVQGICPAGWHVPSDSEWTELTNYLINNYVDINSNNVGNKLKSCRQVNSPLGDDCSTSAHPRWDQHSTHYGTNDFGFGSLPGGHYYDGAYDNLGSYGYWWSSTRYSSTSAWRRRMDYKYGNVSRNFSNEDYGFSVRCLRD